MQIAEGPLGYFLEGFFGVFFSGVCLSGGLLEVTFANTIKFPFQFKLHLFGIFSQEKQYMALK